jgi:hypothetical protein
MTLRLPVMALAAAVFGAAQAQDPFDAYMRNLAIAGNVVAEFGRPAGPAFDAHAEFQYAVQVRWDYGVSISKRGAALELVLTPHFTRVEIGVSHRLRLPASEELDGIRYRTLLHHEYDHVAISTDERPRILLRELIRSMGPIRKVWTGPVPPATAQTDAILSAEIEARKEAVVRLVAEAYERLDRLTDHGRRPVPVRAAFFPSLFGSEHLREAKFPYLSQAERIVGSAEYQTAKRYFRL